MLLATREIGTIYRSAAILARVAGSKKSKFRLIAKEIRQISTQRKNGLYVFFVNKYFWKIPTYRFDFFFVFFKMIFKMIFLFII